MCRTHVPSVQVMGQLGYEMQTLRRARERGVKLAGRKPPSQAQQEPARERARALLAGTLPRGSTKLPSAADLLSSVPCRHPGARVPAALGVKMRLDSKELDAPELGGRMPPRRLSEAQLQKLMSDTPESSDRL